MSQYKVAILMGSDSDLEIMQETAQVLDDFEVLYEVQVLSAHRTPELVSEYVKAAPKKGIQVFICGAGGAAHLAGVVASHTVLPVIGVPVDATPLNGLDALLSTVQMPAGIPVATLAVGKPGARNAGILAVQILALADERLHRKMGAFKQRLVSSVCDKNEKLQEKLKR